MLKKEIESPSLQMANEATKRENVENRDRREEKEKRLQIDFSPAAYQSLLHLREKAGSRTLAEVVRNALRLYEWFLEQKEQGYKIHLIKDNQVKEVELMF